MIKYSESESKFAEMRQALRDAISAETTALNKIRGWKEKCVDLRCDLKDVKAELMEVERELFSVRRRLDNSKKLQECGFCETEMAPYHHWDCYP
jgi:hypothetical protein